MGNMEPNVTGSHLARTRDVGRYKLGKELGRGGMGVVYLAYDPSLQREAALKIANPRSTGTARPRLLREGLALAKLSHPNIVQIYDVGVKDDQVFLAMEFVAGETLANWLARATPRWRAVVQAFVACAHGLHAAHEAGLVHRDFKPHNVLMGEDGRPRVADFGLAGLGGGRTTSSDSPPTFLDASITRTGSKLGTPRYMAPEQHRGEEVGSAADQFALCVALFEALYGVHPFSDPQGIPSADRVTSGTLRSPPRRRGPRTLHRVLERGLALEPCDRYPSTQALAEALLRTTHHSGRRLVGIGLVGSVAIGLSIVGLQGAHTQTCPSPEALDRELWDAQRHERLRSALARRAPAVLERIESYASSWADARIETCERGLEGTVAGAALDASTRCLRRNRVAFDATTEALARDDDSVSTLAWRAATALPSNDECIDGQTRNVESHGPIVGGHAQLVREQLARIRALHTAGDIEAAFVAMDRADQLADQLGFEFLRAETKLVRGRLLMDVMNWDGADSALVQAIDAGLASNHDAVAAEAAARRVFVLAIDGDPRTLDEFVPMATALVTRAGSAPELRALLTNNIAVAHMMVGEFEAADVAFTSAFEATSTAINIDPVDRSGFLVNIAMRTQEAQDRDARFLEALEMAQAGLGPAHPRTLEVEYLRAQSINEPAVALARLARICPRLQERASIDWFRAHQCRWLEAELRADEGATAVAIAAVRHALMCLAANTDPEQRAELKAYQAMTRAFLDTLEGRHRKASERLREADRYFDGKPSAPWIERQRAAATLVHARLPAAFQPPDLVTRLRSAADAFEHHAKGALIFPAAWRHDQALTYLEAQEDEGRSIPYASIQR